MVNHEVILAMETAGCTAKQIAEVTKHLADCLAQQLAARRENDAERKAKSRARKALMSQHVTVTACDIADARSAPSSSPPHPPYNYTHNHSPSEAEEDRPILAANCSVREFRQAIFAVYDRLGFTRPNARRAKVWLAQGYDPQTCLEIIEERLRRKGKTLSLNYFDEALAEAHQPQPLPTAARTGSGRRKSSNAKPSGSASFIDVVTQLAQERHDAEYRETLIN